jgi:hypothetical protein
LCSEFEEFPWGGRKNFGAARSHQGIVFDPNSPNAFHVYAGLQSHHVTRLQKRFLVPSDSGIFMDFQANSMTRTMDKIASEAFMLQNVPGGRIDGPTRYSRLQRTPCRRLRIQDRMVPLAHTRGRLTNVHSARKVAAVAAQYSTEVQHDQLVFPDSARRGTRMWQRRARSGSYNGLE